MLHLLQFGFNTVNHAERVLAEPHDHDSTHDLAFPVQLCDTAPQVRPELDVCHVAHSNRRAPRIRTERDAMSSSEVR